MATCNHMNIAHVSNEEPMALRKCSDCGESMAAICVYCGVEGLPGEKVAHFQHCRWRLTDEAVRPLWARGTRLEPARIGATLSGSFFGRVVVPIFGSDGETWLGWVGRAWVKKAQVPYLYPKGMPRGLVMYRQHVLLEETDEPALCVEGVMDALCAATWPAGTAFLGHESPAQVQALIAAKRPVVQVPDGDAWEAGWALTMRLRLEGQRAGCVRLPPRTDPDEVGDVLRDAARRSLEQVDPVRV